MSSGSFLFLGDGKNGLGGSAHQNSQMGRPGRLISCGVALSATCFHQGLDLKASATGGGLLLQPQLGGRQGYMTSKNLYNFFKIHIYHISSSVHSDAEQLR